MVGASCTAMSPSISRCWILRAALWSSVLACLLLAEGGWAQSTGLRVQRIDQDNDATPGTDFYVFLGQKVDLFCFCDTPGITTLEWLKNGFRIRREQVCITLIEQLRNIGFQDEGKYECRITFANDTVERRNAGTLRVIDPSIIQAPSQQYGLLNFNHTLNCTTPYSSNSTVDIRWSSTTGAPHHSNTGHIDSVSLLHEGVYVCEVFLSTQDLTMQKEVEFFVIVPPVVVQAPPTEYLIEGNKLINLVVEFQSRFQGNTSLTWYKDGLPVPENRVNTMYRNDPNASTELRFDPILKRDAGAYKVVIENKFNVIPLALQQTEANFEVTVTVPPALPSNVLIADTTSTSASVTWDNTNQTQDDAADRSSLSLSYLNGTLAQSLSLDGGLEAWRVDRLVPGMDYLLSLSVHNQDGSRTAEPVTFQTQPGAPSPPSLDVSRQGNTTMSLSVSLAYTGGGNITHLMVEFRLLGTTNWINIGQVEAVSHSDSGLELSVVVMDMRFSGIGIEFRVSAMNSHGHGSEPVERTEELVLPGAPSHPRLLSTSFHTLTLELQLSPEGTSPILGVLVEFTSPSNMIRNISGPFTAGEVVEIEIEDLEDDTTYMFTLAAYNYGGRGTAGAEFQGTTDKLPPIPLYGMVAIGVGFAVVMVIIVVIVVMVTVHCCKVRRKKREYYIDPVVSADDKQLEPNHEMITRTKRPYPTTSSTTSMLSAVTSSHSLFSQTPVSPRSNGTDSPSGRKFRLDAGSSVANSVNQDSDESEINAPRYTYTISTPSPAESEAQLRAQSHHSVATAATHMSTTSTRESLIYPLTESNATDV